jgi:hypothetical protein
MEAPILGRRPSVGLLLVGRKQPPRVQQREKTMAMFLFTKTLYCFLGYRFSEPERSESQILEACVIKIPVELPLFIDEELVLYSLSFSRIAVVSEELPKCMPLRDPPPIARFLTS